jgi:hypothetical protein
MPRPLELAENYQKIILKCMTIITIGVTQWANKEKFEPILAMLGMS